MVEETKRACALVAALLCLAPAAARPAAAKPAARNDVYVVRMLEDPVVAYRGGIPGLRATRPAPGAKLDPNALDVVAYVRFLDGRHAAAVGAVGGRKVYDYRFTFNGFAARLTRDQAAALARVPGVLAVEKDAVHRAVTSSTPAFLGLDAPDGLWSQLGGVAFAGEDVVIGVVDSGVWPESASFSDRATRKDKDGKRAYTQLPQWHGRCVPGEAFTAASCNQKLIGAQYFNAGWGGDAALEAQRPWEFMSPRDYNGHGTHTASTAGGNAGVPTVGPAEVFGAVSGMAPRARIAAYKALWDDGAGSASGLTSDLVAAIDQAVADGVDVINYSISGSRTDFIDAVGISFLFAADAGVFVAASAGNDGPAVGSVAHPGPWVTTVAAGTHNRAGDGSVTLGDGATYAGASVAAAAGPAPFVDATAVGKADAAPDEVRLCFIGALDPAKAAGKIVLCDRGGNARVDKSLAVQQAGGVGMVLVNVTPGSVNGDFHFVPTVHVADTARAALKAYAAVAGATARIAQATIRYDEPAPITASFSSRGPLAASADVLKPDLVAPGQDILAAVAPPGNHGLSFSLYSGTSMSSPHVAGLAALLKDRFPTWSPMMIKSALMTTATDVLDGPSSSPLVIFRQGAGHVRPNLATDPGLVYDSSFLDWFRFLCGWQDVSTSCATVGRIDASDLNAASIAVGDLAGVQTVKRTVRNVGSAAATYRASIAGAGGVDVQVSPASLELAPGESKDFLVTFTTGTAPLNAFVGGQLTWSDGTHSVRSPVVVRPVALAAPAEVTGSYDVQFGYAGAFAATPRGLVPAVTTDGTVTDDPNDEFVKDGPGTTAFSVTIPAGTTYARFALFDASVSPVSDLDLYVYLGDTLVGLSGSGTSSEEVNLVDPPAGTYTVYVHGWAAATPFTAFTLYQWLLGTADAGNLTVTAPSTATVGGKAAIELAFPGPFTPGVKYLGSVAYGGVAGLPSPTIVRHDAP